MNIADSSSSDIKKSFLGALTAHLLLFALVLLATKLNLIPALQVLNPISPEVKMLQTAVRVDVVSMPSQTLKEMKTEEMTPPPENIEKTQSAPTSKSEVDSEKIEKDEEPIGNTVEYKKVGKKDFMSLLKNLSQKEVKGASSGKATKNANAPTLSKEEMNGLIIAGNKLAKGNALSGGSATVDDGAFAQYVSALPFRVKKFWRLPSYLLGRNLKCRIRIFINASGELIKAAVFESSGVEEFDQRAVQAVEAASPFSTPDASFANRLNRGEIALGFPL
ncbi:MAG: TonB family protein [Bacteriovoracaceae bacterium]